MYLALIRVALGLMWVVAARIAGASSAPAWLAFATAVFATAFLCFNDPRTRAVQRPREPQTLLRSLFPSTIGVSVLAAIVVAPQPVLAAFCGGVSAGLGVAGVGMKLLRGGTLYRR
ncbi:MAG TPA: hypothetical protein VJP39_05975 [Gaiellaceae bacterium]|nr:hypothetical protein [Gaiellaceae bacterium]